MRIARRARRGSALAVSACALALAFLGAGCSAASHGESASAPSGYSSTSAIASVAEPHTDGRRGCRQLADSTPIRQLPAAVELQSDARLGRQAQAAITNAVSQLIQIAHVTTNPLSAELDGAAAALKPFEKPVIPSAAQEAVAVKALTTLGKQVQGECDFSVG